ncbi:carboxypeptidase-like regulatory domain-containing protein [Dyadobacter fanqingshengii]|uniref:carboxypeptidase-like regulatory domain-containing protein n=1 Tax=Dyadobacter fanqingshengii TaxID=2906443 RepID=UPI0020787F0E|nr:carboxypeptidase-like regulatory domain-containing protein [Dyadobacter fanqingshengii]USJ37941.1 carboxypeptidase-like regulatory domain-containing protein [Dyadobacter fanqingshengii]
MLGQLWTPIRGLPLVGATVSLSPAEAGTITDPQSTFRFDVLPVGRCWRPIDVEYSETLKTTLYEARSHYSVKMKDYFRPDLRWEF